MPHMFPITVFDVSPENRSSQIMSVLSPLSFEENL
jgi:hypothetical protein